jgi:hypothetical protein
MMSKPTETVFLFEGADDPPLVMVIPPLNSLVKT